MTQETKTQGGKRHLYNRMQSDRNTRTQQSKRRVCVYVGAASIAEGCIGDCLPPSFSEVQDQNKARFAQFS